MVWPKGYRAKFIVSLVTNHAAYIEHSRQQLYLNRGYRSHQCFEKRDILNLIPCIDLFQEPLHNSAFTRPHEAGTCNLTFRRSILSFSDLRQWWSACLCIDACWWSFHPVIGAGFRFRVSSDVNVFGFLTPTSSSLPHKQSVFCFCHTRSIQVT